jgi:Protein of unknown function (DUF4232)
VKGLATVGIWTALAFVGSAQAAPTPKRCSTRQLHVWVTHSGAAGGTVGGYLAFTNLSPRACTLRGWPGLTAFRPGASRKAIHIHETMFGPYAVRGGIAEPVRGIPVVLLHHGQTGVAAFTAGDFGPGRTGACPPSYQHLRVTPPGNASSTVIPAWIAWYGRNLPDCTGIEVSMVVPAADMPPRG